MTISSFCLFHFTNEVTFPWFSKKIAGKSQPQFAYKVLLMKKKPVPRNKKQLVKKNFQLVR